MFTLLTPSALLALLGLLVPVAIHLWNRRPGREVAVGSLRWLAAGANRRLRRLRPEQLGLLLLRATLLAVLAVAVAGPVWRQARPAGRGQVLLGPALLGNPTLAALRPTIDSLRRRGYGLRWLAAGFPRVPGAAWRADPAGPSGAGRPANPAPAPGTPTTDFYWARAQLAAAAFPGQPLFVVTPASLRNFRGSRSPLPAGVTWHTLPAAGAATWLQAAALRPDSLRLLLGRSTENQTGFDWQSVARPRPGALLRVAGLPPLRFEAGADGARLRPLSQTSDSTNAPRPAAVAVRAQPVRILLYSTPDYAPDARYLRAGLRAAAAGLPVPLALTTTAQAPDPAARPDWLFWLSDAPVPAAWRAAARRGTRIWQPAAGPGVADTAQLATTAADAASVALFRRGAGPAPASAQLLWTDGRGRAVLARQALGRGALYQLSTRLDPAWSELANDPALPARLLALLQPEPTDDTRPDAHPDADADAALAAHDQRALDPAQLDGSSGSALQTHSAAAPRPAPPPTYRFADLRPWLVLAAGLLFLLERWLAHRRNAHDISQPAP